MATTTTMRAERVPGVVLALMRETGLSIEQLRDLMARGFWVLDAIEHGTLGATAIALAFLDDEDIDDEDDLAADPFDMRGGL